MPITINECVTGRFPEMTNDVPDKSFDHTITDPPYSEHVHSNQMSGAKDGKFSLSFRSMRIEERIEFARQIVRLTKKWALIFCDLESVGDWKVALEFVGATYKRCVLWIKPGAMPQFSGDRPAVGGEAIVCVWCGEGRSTWNGHGKVGVYFHAVPRGEERVHETQKPFGLMLDLVRDFTSEDDIVFDPFAGSGTTLLAAKAINRRFVGIEESVFFREVSAQRLAYVRNPKQLALL